jgi:LPXTG-motif cell wall-anchored protein
MLLVAMLAMVLATAVPAFAQDPPSQDLDVAQCLAIIAGGDATGGGDGVVSGDVSGDGNAVGGDATGGAVSDSAIVQECVQIISQAGAGGDLVIVKGDTIVIDGITVVDLDGDGVIIVKEAVEQGVSLEVALVAVAEASASASASASVVSGDAAAASGGELPDTGGASLFTLGAGALLVAGGLLARRIVR